MPLRSWAVPFDVFDQLGGVHRCGNDWGKVDGEPGGNRVFTVAYSSLMADGVSAILGSDGSAELGQLTDSAFTDN